MIDDSEVTVLETAHQGDLRNLQPFHKQRFLAVALLFAESVLGTPGIREH